MPRGEPEAASIKPYRFQPGNPGGPGRRPRAHEERDLERLRKVYTPELEADVVKAMIAQAAEGNVQAAEWLDKRLYGAIVEKREVDSTVTNRRVRVVLMRDGERVEELPETPEPERAQ